MASWDSSSVSTHNERQQEEELDLLDEVERGIHCLRWLTSMETMLPVPRRHQSRVPCASLPENTLRLLQNWLSEPPGSGSNILWLSGVPTSFNTDDFMDICRQRCLLAGIFSFTSRKGSEQVKEIVPTLALQICSNIPSLRPTIGLAAFHFPNIFSAGLPDQLEALVFNPFRQYASMRELDLPAVLVIDGLELYHDVETQKILISSIETIATTSTTPLRFLLTSRQGSREYGLSLLPGTHLHIHSGSKSAPLHKLQSAFMHNSLQKANTLSYHGFPQPLQTQTSISDAESYTRSLIMLGHGIPLWRPKTGQAVPAKYLHQGPQIGDVMYITGEGSFHFVVNIFRGHDDLINSKMGMEGQYKPLNLDPSEVTRVENYLKPGAVITSTGVVSVTQCDDPLTINFKSTSEEGALRVLPEGASREDLISTKRLHKYVQRWAPYWHKYERVPNGSIFIVTGCDKAADFACATFSSNPSYRETREIDIDYVRREQGENPWNNQGRARAHYLRYSDSESHLRSTIHAQTRRFCVFIRGMRIALSNAVWSSYNTSAVARNSISYTNVLHKSPLVGHATESLLVRLHCRPREGEALRRVSEDHDPQIFHPIFALGPDLFQKYPRASVVVINDSDWGMLTQQGHGDWTHIRALMDQFYRQFAVVEENGVVSLSRKAESNQKNMTTGRGVSLPRLFRRNNGHFKIISVTKYAKDLGEIPGT